MINLSILTLEGPLYEDKADSLLVPSIAGQLGILPNHIPLITALKYGKIIVKKGGEIKEIEIEKGFIEIRPKSEVAILATIHKQ